MNLFQNKWGKLAYHRIGDGQETTLIFHGFGQDHRDMLPFEAWLGPDSKLIFLDMYYHGSSAWSDPTQPLSKEIWSAVISGLMLKEKFSSFHLIGYSMGGKFSLITYELFAGSIKSLTLLAPDGIKTGLWYNLNSYPRFLQLFFRQVIFKPRRFFDLVDSLEGIGLVKRSLAKFVRNEMNTRSKRAQVYLAWRVFGKIKPDLAKIIQEVNLRKTPFRLILAEYDKMVTEENLNAFSSKIQHIQVISLPVGHGQLIAETVKQLPE